MVFSTLVNVQQRVWLSSTTVPINSITLSRDELASEFCPLVRSVKAGYALCMFSRTVGAM